MRVSVFAFITLATLPLAALAQTNTFPASGNVGIGTTNPLYQLDISAPPATTALHVSSNVLIDGALHVSGNVLIDGNIAARYQDVAEWVPASTLMEAGTVVVLNRKVANEVTPSWREYDTAVAGVVSARPGLILGEQSASKVQVATTGRVKVRVDATKQPILIGDLLVSGSKPGTAMKSQPVSFGGIEMHRPGTLIGKALEPLASGECEILVLLCLQ